MSDKQQMMVDAGKAGSAWAAVSVTWSDIAAILASLYTLLLIGEWLWKKAFRRFALNRGLIKGARKEDSEP